MIALVTAVFLASVLGSLHCAGMCGAFVAFAVADSGGKPGRRVMLNMAYHGGRLTTYVALGVAAGSVGALLDLSGALVGLSRVAMSLTGALMIVFGLSAVMAAMGKRSIRMPVPKFMQKALTVGHRAAMRLSPCDAPSRSACSQRSCLAAGCTHSPPWRAAPRARCSAA
ncbi:MAG: sulfite exporter TauE/SafE family protein [Planctomycetota bacterium]